MTTTFKSGPTPEHGDTPFQAAWPGGAPTNGELTEKPNSIVILIDDVDFSFYRWNRPYTAPEAGGINVRAATNQYQPACATLEAIATRGLTFLNARAEPVCSPTRASILTGMKPGASIKGGQASLQKGHGVANVPEFYEGDVLTNFGTGVMDEFGGTAVHDVHPYSKALVDATHGWPGTLDPAGDLEPGTIKGSFVFTGKWHLGLPTADMQEAHHTGIFPARDWGTGWPHIGSKLGADAKHSTVFSNLAEHIMPNPEEVTPGGQGRDMFYNYRIQGLTGSVAHVNGTYGTGAGTDKWVVKRQFDDALTAIAEVDAPAAGADRFYVCHIHSSFAHDPYSQAHDALIADVNLYGDDAVHPDQQVPPLPALPGAAQGALSQMGRMQAFDKELEVFLIALAAQKDAEITTLTAALDALEQTTNIYFVGDNGGESQHWLAFHTNLGNQIGLPLQQNLADSSTNYTHTEGTFKRTTFEAGTRIPMLVFGPMVGGTMRGKQTRAMVDICDVPVTVWDTLGGGTKLAEYHAANGSFYLDGVSFKDVCGGLESHVDHGRQWSLCEKYFPLGDREDTSHAELGFAFWFPATASQAITEGTFSGDGGLYKIVRRASTWSGGTGSPIFLDGDDDNGEWFFHLQEAGQTDMDPTSAGAYGSEEYAAAIQALNVNSPDPWERVQLMRRESLQVASTPATGANAPTNTEKAAYAYGVGLLDALLDQAGGENSSKYVLVDTHKIRLTSTDKLPIHDSAGLPLYEIAPDANGDFPITTETGTVTLLTQED